MVEKKFMIGLVCYASDNMVISQEKLVVSSLKYGVERIFSYSYKDIDPFFKGVNQKTLSAERGAGYWLWKPYVINKALLEMNEGDYLIYCDAGIEIMNDVSHLINSMDEDILLFSNGWKHVEWCKGEVLKAILGDWMVYENNPQVQASAIVMKVTYRAKQFMREWLAWCQIPGFIDDSLSEGNYPTFADHRHDQSILTCLQIRYNFKLHWWPTQYSEHIKFGYDDKYPAMFNHHRKRNNEW